MKNGKGYYYNELFFNALKDLDPATRVKIHDAFDQYVFNAVEPSDLNSVELALFRSFQPMLDGAIAYHQAKIEAGRKGGLNGGAPMGNQNARKQSKTNQNKAKQTYNNNNNNNNNNNVLLGTDNSAANTTTKFIKPTVEEVQTYISEKGFSIDANYFFDFYSANGWMCGRTHMKDWKATVRTWQAREQKKTKQNKPDARQTGIRTKQFNDF